MKYPDRYVITAIVKEGENKGKKVWLYWIEESGGWWQWSDSEAWAYRFETKSGQRFDDAMKSCPKMGPWYYYPDPSTIKAEPTPAIVKVY